MLQRLGNGDYIWQSASGEIGSISNEVLSKLCTWRQSAMRDLEAGGVLLGFIDIETSGLLATEITTPGFGDKRTRTGFYRGRRHQREVKRWHEKTINGTLIGLWHTHPEKKPTPSAVDLQDAAHVLKNGSYASSGLLYLIVGIAELGVWHATPNKALELLGYIDVN